MKKTTHVIRRADTSEYLKDVMRDETLIWTQNIFDAWQFIEETLGNEKILDGLIVEYLEVEISIVIVKRLEVQCRLSHNPNGTSSSRSRAA